MSGLWHKPEGSKAWHYYGIPSGFALCSRWSLIGHGTPADARQRKPVNACKDCLKRKAQP